MKKNKRERYQDIIDAAKHLIARHGSEAVPQREIMNKVNCSQPLFYFYFDSNEHLIREVLRDILSHIDNMTDEEVKIICGIFFTSEKYLFVLLQLLENRNIDGSIFIRNCLLKVIKS